ncbi:MAG: VOC family protein [Pseudomonadota bacterium]
MRLWLSLAFCFSLLTSARAEEAYDGAYFKRVNFVVADLDRALTVYRDVLGFNLDRVTVSSSTSYSYSALNIPQEAKLRFATLSAGAHQVRTLALTEVTGIPLPEQKGIFQTASVIRVGNLNATIAALEALGLKTVPRRDVDGAEFSFGEQAFVDYDGHLVVLYEITSSE